MPDALRIAVFGSESTGKTQLAEKLAAHFGTTWVPEYAREFWDRHGAIALGDISGIAREQWRREDELTARATRLVICDTGAHQVVECIFRRIALTFRAQHVDGHPDLRWRGVVVARVFDQLVA